MPTATNDTLRYIERIQFQRPAAISVVTHATKREAYETSWAVSSQVAALTSLSAQIEEMAVEAALCGNPRLVYQAVCHDPLTAAVLSLAEIKAMVNDMLAQNRDYLPQFARFEA